MSEKTKKQHYVPRCYLKAWKIKDNNQIYVYDKVKQESRINNIEDVASERYFYDFSLRDFLSEQDINALFDDTNGLDIDSNIQLVETALSVAIEDPYADFLNKILKKAGEVSNWHLKNCYFLHPDYKETFSGFLAVQYVRTASVRNMIRDISDEMSQFVAMMDASPNMLEEYHTLTKDEAKNIHIGMMLQEEHLSELAFYFKRLKWVLGINRTGIKLLTSDNPICTVAHCNNGPFQMNGLASKGVEVFIPLSPECILIMLDGDYHKVIGQHDMNYIEIENKDIIEYYNSHICMHAERSIFSSDGDFDLIYRLKEEDERLVQVPESTLNWGEVIFKSRVR